ncbi:MAG: hypothetical protein RL213_28 [Bacteroidota bacterium]
MNKKILLFLLLFSGTVNGNGQSFHIRCLSIDAAGGVTATWDRGTLAVSDFRAYHILYSNAQAGPYSTVDSVSVFSDTAYTHASANANTSAAWYVIVCKGLTGPDRYSDTVRALQLTVLNPGSGFANLAWNVMRQPLITTHSPFYRIFREYPAGFFTLIDSVNAALSPNPMRYSDLISICDDTVNYRIEVMDAGGCVSNSNIDGDRFRDLQPPMMPVLDSVSVDVSGNVVIGWPSDPSPDTRAYVVLQGVGSIWTPIDTLFGISSTFTSTGISAAGGAVSFELIAVDSCGNPSAQSQPHTTMYLSGSFDRCARSVTLTWNPYSSWNSTVTYEILRSTAGGPEQRIGSTLSTSFEDTAIVSGTSYCYRVIARESGLLRSSTSSRLCLTPTFPIPPNFCRIRTVSVTGPSTVQVTVFADAAAVVQGYRLLRAPAATGPFTTVSTLNVSGTSSVVFQDVVSDLDERIYHYRVVVIDSCGNPVRTSLTARTIRLRGESLPGACNEVSWTSYGEWSSGVDGYLLFRSVNGITDPNPVAVVPDGQTLSFLDAVLEEFYSDGTFCYRVAALQAPGDPDGFIDTSFSNEVCVFQDPLVFVPSAFHPGGGINEIFQPMPVFMPRNGYRFIIYNRWGQVVFSTDDPTVGWDGSMNGTAAEQAVYIYLIEAEKKDGTRFQKTGSVTLLRY